MHTPPLFIIIPIHNRSKTTQNILLELLHSLDSNSKIILVDDGSTDDSVAKAKSIHSNVHILSGNGNLWWAGSLQLAYKYLTKVAPSNSFLVIMNDDITISKDFISKIREWLLKEPNKIHYPLIQDQNTGLIEKLQYIHWVPLHFSSNAQSSDICISTRCIALTWKTHISIGGFYPLLLPHYLSDYEFTLRASRKSIPFKNHPEMTIYSNSLSSGNHTISEISRINTIRNLFSKKYSANPVFRINFILLCSPRKYLVHSLTKELYIFAYKLYKILIRGSLSL